MLDYERGLFKAPAATSNAIDVVDEEGRDGEHHRDSIAHWEDSIAKKSSSKIPAG